MTVENQPPTISKHAANPLGFMAFLTLRETETGADPVCSTSTFFAGKREHYLSKHRLFLLQRSVEDAFFDPPNPVMCCLSAT